MYIPTTAVVGSLWNGSVVEVTVGGGAVVGVIDATAAWLDVGVIYRQSVNPKTYT